MTIRQDFCPNCMKDCEIEALDRIETIRVRGEVFRARATLSRCRECGDEFAEVGRHVDPLEEAYALYRERHGYTTPEQMVAFRNQYGLTQKELSGLLGWGGATLSRYENGALQDEAHEKQLRLAMKPDNLVDLIESSPGLLPREKVDRIRRAAREAPRHGSSPSHIERWAFQSKRERIEATPARPKSWSWITAPPHSASGTTLPPLECVSSSLKGKDAVPLLA